VRYANGDTFDGAYRDGKKCGHGVQDYFKLADTSQGGEESGTYTGMWKCDQRSGQGVLRWSDGSSYEGEWR
jgi:hypothetical protein